MSESGRYRVFCLAPSNLPRHVSSEISAYGEADVISFQMYPQRLKIVNVSCSGYIVTLDSSDSFKTVPPTTFGLNASTGLIPTFSQVLMTRHASPQVIASVIQQGQQAMVTSLSQQNESSFISYSVGNRVNPGLLDTSIMPNHGSTRFDLAAISPRTPAMSPMMHFQFSPLSGALNTDEALDLREMGGMDLHFTVGHWYEVFQSTYTSNAVQDNGMYYWPAPADATTVNPWTGIGSISKSTTSYRLAVLEPKLWVVCYIPDDAPGVTSYLYPNVTIDKTQMIPTNNLVQSYDLQKVYVREFLWFLQDRTRVYDSQFGPNTNLTMFTQKNQLLINAIPQLYSYPTGTPNQSVTISPVTPDAFVVTAATLDSDVSVYTRVYGGGLLLWDYDNRGNGVLMNRAILTLVWNTFNKEASAWPFNQLPGDTMASGFPSYRQANVSLPVAATPAATSAQNVLVPSTNQRLMMPSVKFIGNFTPTSNLELNMVTKSTETAVINGNASTVVAAAKPATRIPAAVNFVSCSGPSNIRRNVVTRVNGQVINNPMTNCDSWQYLLPDSGVLGDVFFNCTPQLDNHSDIQLGYEMFSSTMPTAGGGTPNFVGYQLAAGTGTFNFTILTATYADNSTYPALRMTIPQAAPAVKTRKFDGNNLYPYRKGFAASLGGCSVVRGLEVVLPNQTHIQRLELQTYALLSRFGLPFSEELREVEFTSRLTNGYVAPLGSDGIYTDVLPNRDNGLMFDSFNTAYAVSHDTNAQLSDFPLNSPWRICLDVMALDEAMKKFRGVPLNTDQRRELWLHVDKRCDLSLSDLGADLCRPEGALIAVLDDNPLYRPKPKFNRWSMKQGKYAPYLSVSQVYYDTATQARVVADFKANGVQMTIDDYYIQRRFAVAGEGGFDNISSTFLLPIGGRNPRTIAITNKAASNEDGDLGLGNSNSPYWSRFLPYYIASRHGAWGYSTIPGLNAASASNTKTNWVMEYQVELDDTEIYASVNYGTAEMDLINFGLAFSSHYARPDWEINWGSTHLCHTWTPYITSTATAMLGDDPLARVAYVGCPLLPTQRVSMIVIPDNYENAAMFRLNTITENNTKLQRNWLGKVAIGTDSNWVKVMNEPTYFMREYAFHESYTVSFGTNTCAVTYNFPAGIALAV